EERVYIEVRVSDTRISAQRQRKSEFGIHKRKRRRSCAVYESFGTYERDETYATHVKILRNHHVEFFIIQAFQKCCFFQNTGALMDKLISVWPIGLETIQ
ncbi:hypothetical protein PENTCL1PPCAC_21432, partial [Pristionchus entomophagus]